MLEVSHSSWMKMFSLLQMYANAPAWTLSNAWIPTVKLTLTLVLLLAAKRNLWQCKSFFIWSLEGFQTRIMVRLNASLVSWSSSKLWSRESLLASSALQRRTCHGWIWVVVCGLGEFSTSREPCFLPSAGSKPLDLLGLFCVFTITTCCSLI